MLKKSLHTLIMVADTIFGKLVTSIPGRKSHLLSFMFHNLFNTDDEMHSDVIDPQQGLTMEDFRVIIEYFQSRDFRFICHDDLRVGLEPKRNAVMITFDDGYASNVNALQVLEEFGVPATFFISTGNVLENRGYWWDILYRERKKQGTLEERIQKEQAELKKLDHISIDRYLAKNFGKQSLKPVSDLDRPFSPRELRVFAAHRLVRLGNHTVNHAILTNYRDAEARRQISQCQVDLEKMTGYRPGIISYPNGNYSEEIIAMCIELGLTAGITVEPGKNHLPLAGEREMMTLGRYTIFRSSDVKRQCLFIDSQISLLAVANRMRGK